MTHVDLTEQLLAFVEIPKGGRNKYEYDEESGRIVLDRFLSSSMVYPADYGFLMGHRGSDGDPLDCLVCVSEATFPGCVIPVNPVAMFEMEDEAGIDDKIVCVPVSDPGWNAVTCLEELPEQLKLEDPSLLLGLQGPRARGGQGRRLEVSRGGGSDDERGPPAPARLRRRKRSRLN